MHIMYTYAHVCLPLHYIHILPTARSHASSSHPHALTLSEEGLNEARAPGRTCHVDLIDFFGFLVFLVFEKDCYIKQCREI